jgi:plasmid maintenance system antidote protein VapI
MFGPELRAAVQEALWSRGITQRDLSRQIGVTEGAVSRLLSGTRGTTFEMIDRLADALSLEVVVRPRSKRKGD